MEHTNAMFVNDYVEEEEEEENNNVSGAFTENELIEQFYNYLRDNNIKEARRLLRTYSCFNKLNICIQRFVPGGFLSKYKSFYYPSSFIVENLVLSASCFKK